MNDLIKLSSPATREFWEISVLFEDAHLLALHKPSRLLTSTHRSDPQRPNLMKLLHQDIERNAPWTRQRCVQYLAIAHRLDFESSGVILLAKDKPTLIHLANQFGAEKPTQIYLALVQGAPTDNAFEVDARLAPHPVRAEIVRVDKMHGKKAKTNFEVRERFSGYTLLQCVPLTGRTHQIRVHLQHVGLPIVGDAWYGGSQLLLSRLKSNYRLKPGHTERPLLDRVALHAEQLTIVHPILDTTISISAPWPKDLTVAAKYLRRFAPAA